MNNFSYSEKSPRFGTGFNQMNIRVRPICFSQSTFYRWGRSCDVTFLRDSVYQKLLNYHYYNRFTAPWTLSGTTRVSRYQKGKTRKVKPILIHWSKRSWLSGSGISWAICRSAPRPRQITTPKLLNRFIFTEIFFKKLNVSSLFWNMVDLRCYQPNDLLTLNMASPRVNNNLSRLECLLHCLCCLIS